MKKRPREGGNRFGTVIGCALYVAAAIRGYEITADLGYAYMGFQVRYVPGWALAVAIGLAVLPSLFLPLSLRKPSAMLLWMLYFIAFVPLTFVPMYSLDATDPVNTLRFSGWVTATFVAVILSTGIRRASFGTIPLALGWPALIVLLLAFYGYLAATHGLSLRPVSIEQVYDTRSEFKEEVARAGRASTYMVFWLSSILNPLFIALGVTRRRPFLVVCGVLGQLTIYSLTGLKAVMLTIVLIPLMSLLIGRKLHRFAFRVAWAAAGGFLLALCWTLPTQLLVRRLLITGIVSGWYYEFFSQNPQVHMGNTILGFLTDYPYDLPVPSLIAERYLHTTTTSANANLWADAFANFGLGGIVVWSVILALYLWALDSVARGRDTKLCALLLVSPGVSLSNVALQTALLTHGLALLLLVMLALPKKEEVPHRTKNAPSRRPLQLGA